MHYQRMKIIGNGKGFTEKIKICTNYNNQTSKEMSMTFLLNSTLTFLKRSFGAYLRTLSMLFEFHLK